MLEDAVLTGAPDSSPISKIVTTWGCAPSRPIGLRLACDPFAADVVEAFGLDSRERHVSVEARVVREEDALLAALTEETVGPS